MEGLHYLDDFLLFGDPNSEQYERALRSALAHCNILGGPVAPQKTEGPSTTLTFLGLELDTMSLTVRLPSAKLDRLRREVQRWQGLKSCSMRELLSLIGQLQHACCAIRPGRSFLRRILFRLEVVGLLPAHLEWLVSYGHTVQGLTPGGYCEFWQKQDGQGHALDEVPVLLLSQVGSDIGMQAHTESTERGSRYTVT